MTIIQGLHHRMVSEDEVHWTITRGQFEMARIIGTIEEAREELAKWDATVGYANLPTKHGTSPEGATPPHSDPNYTLLTTAGFSPAKAAEIILDAKRGDRYAQRWIDLLQSTAATPTSK